MSLTLFNRYTRNPSRSLHRIFYPMLRFSDVEIANFYEEFIGIPVNDGLAMKAVPFAIRHGYDRPTILQSHQRERRGQYYTNAKLSTNLAYYVIVANCNENVCIVITHRGDCNYYEIIPYEDALNRMITDNVVSAMISL